MNDGKTNVLAGRNLRRLRRRRGDRGVEYIEVYKVMNKCYEY